MEGLFTYINIKVINYKNKIGFETPLVYENIVVQDGYDATIFPTIVDDKILLPENGYGSCYVFSIYDLDKNKKLFLDSHCFSHSQVPIRIKPKSDKPSKGVLVAVAVDQ